MMAAYQEDVQSVLEQFVENVANLPAELAHLFEEMQAKDKRMAELREVIATKDTSIQRFIKQNGSNVPYAKESSYTKIITDSYAEVSRIQTEKCALASKAMDLITRHIKRLDLKIKDLQTDGLLPNEPIVTPTFLATLQAPALVPTGSSKTNNSSSNGPNSNSRLPPHASTGNTPTNGTTTPTGAAIRDHVTNSINAAGNDPKRRRLPGGSISLPTAPSPLNTSMTSSGLNLPVNRDSLPARTAHTGRKAPPPKGAHRRSGLNKRKDRDEEEDDDVDDSDDDEEEEEAGEDHRPYCTCRQVSYGDMVACDDPTCPFEWFHWSCVGLQREPVGKWFCDHCSAKRNGKLPKKDGSVS